MQKNKDLNKAVVLNWGKSNMLFNLILYIVTFPFLCICFEVSPVLEFASWAINVPIFYEHAFWVLCFFFVENMRMEWHTTRKSVCSFTTDRFDFKLWNCKRSASITQQLQCLNVRREQTLRLLVSACYMWKDIRRIHNCLLGFLFWQQ